jgi:arsenate reductase
MTEERQRVLFICWHNSARSQMAEGFLRAFAGERFDAFSAGIEAAPVRPEATAVMAEIGIDIGGQRSKTLHQFLDQPFDWLITVCDDARQSCPVFPGVERTLHWSIEDPARATGPDDVRLLAFRGARDDLRNRIRMFVLAASRDDLPRPAPERLRGPSGTAPGH